MSNISGTPCWADLVSSSIADPTSAADRQKFLDHIAGCPVCQRVFTALEAEGMLDEWPDVAPLEEPRSAAIRARLVERAGSGNGGSQPASAASGLRRSLTGAAGWMVAAGLATLLLTHHTFHEPLDFGWVAASVLGVVALFLGYRLYILRKRLHNG